LIATGSVSSGIFGAHFLKEGNEAYIESTWGSMIKLDSGEISSLYPGADIRLAFEDCPEFRGKSLFEIREVEEMLLRFAATARVRQETKSLGPDDPSLLEMEMPGADISTNFVGPDPRLCRGNALDR